MNTFRQTEISLRGGQSVLTHVRRGTHLVVTKGSVHLDGPCIWVGETVVSVGCKFGEGQVHVVEEPGWVEISAKGDATVLQYAPPTMVTAALHTLWEQAGRWLGRTEILPKSAR